MQAFTLVCLNISFYINLKIYLFIYLFYTIIFTEHSDYQLTIIYPFYLNNYLFIIIFSSHCLFYLSSLFTFSLISQLSSLLTTTKLPWLGLYGHG